MSIDKMDAKTELVVGACRPKSIENKKSKYFTYLDLFYFIFAVYFNAWLTLGNQTNILLFDKYAEKISWIKNSSEDWSIPILFIFAILISSFISSFLSKVHRKILHDTSLIAGNSLVVKCSWEKNIKMETAVLLGLSGALAYIPYWFTLKPLSEHLSLLPNLTYIDAGMPLVSLFVSYLLVSLSILLLFTFVFTKILIVIYTSAISRFRTV